MSKWPNQTCAQAVTSRVELSALPPFLFITMYPALGGEDGEGREGKTPSYQPDARSHPSSALLPDVFCHTLVSALAIGREGVGAKEVDILAS